MAGLQTARVKEQEKVRAAKLAKQAEKPVQAEKEPEYNKDHLVQVVCAILAADKTKLLDIPSCVIRAKQVLNEL